MELPGQGTILKVATVDAPTIFTAISQRTVIGGPSMANGEKTDTDLDDVCVKTSATIPDLGELSLTLNYDPFIATHVTLLGLYVSGDEVNWELIFNDHLIEASRSKWTFSGWVKTFQPGGFETESNVSAELSIRVNSIPVSTPRAS